MKRIYSFAVAVMMLFSSHSLYAAEYYIAPYLKINLEFEPDKEQIITNPLFWSVSIECDLVSDIVEVPIKVMSLKNATKINGVLLEEGKQLQLTLSTNNKLSIKSEGSAKVSLTSLANKLVVAKCDI